MTTTYTLQLVPSTHKVVPIEPTEDMQIVALNENDWILGSIRDDYVAMVKAAPPLDTPPVLRWEGDSLMVYGAKLAIIYYHCIAKTWTYSVNGLGSYPYLTQQEARRAVEKALGFPDWLIIEEVV